MYRTTQMRHIYCIGLTLFIAMLYAFIQVNCVCGRFKGGTTVGNMRTFGARHPAV